MSFTLFTGGYEKYDSKTNIWSENTFLDNFFKAIYSVIYWRLITEIRVDSVVVKPVNII